MNTQTTELTLTIDALTNGPHAVGRTPEGHTVFVPLALPGETARVRITRSKKRLKWAELAEVIAPSPHRISPRCPHYGTCGGCHLQHTGYDHQRHLKREIVIDQLQRIAGLAPPVAETLPAPHPWHYRDHLQLVQDSAGTLGLPTLDGETVIPLEECPAAAPPLFDFYRQLDIEPLPNVEFIDLRLGTENDIMLLLALTGGPPPAIEIDLPISVVSLGVGGDAVVLAGDDHLVCTVKDRPFRVSAASRFPANTAHTAALVEQALTALDLQPGDVVFDLFGNVGLFSAFIAPAAAQVVIFEENDAAIEDIVVNLDEFDNISLYGGPLPAALAQMAAPPGKLFLAPPPDGAGKAVIEAILALAPPRIVYASSEPVTLARDSQQLAAGGYQLAHVQPIDLAPQAHHIHMIATFQCPTP